VLLGFVNLIYLSLRYKLAWHFISLCEWFVMSSVLLYMQVHRKTFTTMARLYCI
jgi:hypothetical protein